MRSIVLQLLDVIAGLNRGVSADEIDRAKVDELAQELEKINPTKQPLKSPLVNGQWELIYTTSASIIGTKKPPYLRPQGPIYQLIGTSIKMPVQDSSTQLDSRCFSISP